MDQHNNKNSIDEIDQHIIEALQMDGRRPFTKIAADLGISEASVRQRVANLINTQVMQIVAITNPIKLGFSLASMIGIRVSGERLLEAAQEISTFDEVIYLIICTGSFDLLAEVVCRDNDHLLSFLTSDGRKAALDLRLMVRDAAVGEEAKVYKAARNIYRIWEEGREAKTTQLVFCDLSTPHPERFNVYDEVKRLLLAYGIPEQEIAYIHDAETDAQKQELYDALNAGRKRILFGSTEKCGAGTNVQRRLIALHHLDAPWRPRDIEQREGRILRQGNMHDVVQIVRYATEGSFDAYMWQTLETKARFIQQVMSGQVTVREAEDLEGGALSYAEIKAIASGNPVVLEKVKIDTEVRRLDILRAAHINMQYDIAKQVRELPERIGRTNARIEGLVSDLHRRTAHDTGEFAIAIGDVTYRGKKEREQAAHILIMAIQGMMFDQEVKVIGKYKGFEIFVKAGRADTFYLRGHFVYGMHFDPNNLFDNIKAMDAELKYLERDIENDRENLAQMQKNLADFQEQLGRPFEHEAALTELLRKQQEINEKLDLDKSDTQIVDEEKAA